MSGLNRKTQALLAHPGTQYSAQLARLLCQNDSLYRFWTGFALADGTAAARFLKLVPGPQKWLGNRVVLQVPPEKMRTIMHLELLAQVRLRFGTEPQMVLHDRNEAFQKAIPGSEIEACDVVIGFDTSSSILASRAHATGKAMVMDQTIAHPSTKRRVYKALRAQYPDWAGDLEIRDAAVSAAEDVELREVDRVVAASSFTKATLIENNVDPDRIILNSYGVDLQRFLNKRGSQGNRPFRFLFAGLVCARKGIPLLLEAWRALSTKNAELWLVGPITATAKARLADTQAVRILGKVSNTDLATLMSECDVFVFPSYFEGFGLVLLEAMASGLPVITTAATAGPDIITEGADGWIIEPGDVDALVEVMRFCSKNPVRVTEMGTNARRTAERFTWDAYAGRWLQLLRELSL